jgi:hypothetical protein
MKKNLVLSLYRNSRGVVVGDLYAFGGQQRILATTHPATIAAAVFAMAEESFVFRAGNKEKQFKFPILLEELGPLASLLADQAEGHYMSCFATFSQFDFAHPLPFDTQAEIHFRVAVHHLKSELVAIRPMEPAPKGFKKELRNRNRFVYYPYC